MRVRIKETAFIEGWDVDELVKLRGKVVVARPVYRGKVLYGYCVPAGDHDMVVYVSEVDVEHADRKQ